MSHGTSRKDLRSGRGRQTRTFRATTIALERLALAGERVAVHITDLDRGEVVLAGDDHLPLPVGGLGIVPLLIETAARIEARTASSVLAPNWLSAFSARPSIPR